jgi:hypothetical protein
MNDDNSKVRAQDMTSTYADSENSNQENNNPRVFDITPDLDIAPAKDEEDNGPTQISGIKVPNTTPIPEIVDITQKNVGTVSVNIPQNQKDSNPANIGEITINKAPEPNPSNFTGPLNAVPTPPTTSFGPANPPAKTIGMNKISFNKEVVEQSKTVEPTNLQDAVSSIKLTPDQKIPTNIPPRPYETKKDSKIKPLRTYETDFAEAISKKHITTTSAVIAEQNRAQTAPKVQDTTIAVPIPPYKGNQNQTTYGYSNSPSNIPRPEPKELPLNTISKYENPLFAKKPIATELPAQIENKPIQPLQANETAQPIRPIESIQEVQSSILKNNIPINPPPQTIRENFTNNIPQKNEQIVDDRHPIRNTLLVLISLILLGGGGYAGYYLYTKSPLALVQFTAPKNTDSNQPQMLENKSIFPADSKIKISIDGKNQSQIIKSIKDEFNKVGKENTIEEIVLTKTTNNVIQKITANELNNILRIDAPSLITRSLNDDFMIGIYNGIGGQRNFFAITTNNFFQNAFAGMIEWEKNMPSDLKDYLYNNTDQFSLKGNYKDRIVRNKDVREYVSDNDHIVFLYSFLSNDKMIITNDELALENIIIRLEKTAFVR